MKQTLLEKVNIVLLKKGFTVKNLIRSCFDVLTRRQSQILLIKVLEDANSISRQYATDMQSVASYINASPLIIAEKAGEKLDDNIIYSRFNVYTLNLNTFINCIDNKFPLIKRNQAGLIANISGKRLKEKMVELGYSLHTMSKKIGVTSRMVIKYENENSEVSIGRAMRIYDLIGDTVFNEINIFIPNFPLVESKLETDISRKYIELDFEATETKKTPFDIIAKKGKALILTGVTDNVNPDMEPVSKLLDANALVIFEKKKPSNIPSLTKKEFMDLEEADKLVRFVKEF